VMSDFVTDTHGLIWYLEDSPRLGSEARAAFDACDHGRSIVCVPTICMVEIVYLQEKGRIPSDMMDKFYDELRSRDSGLAVVDLTLGVVEALVRVSRTEVSDMPDRIIAATALHLNFPLISRDRRIQLSDIETIW
jgi:PIN domain nuclease of toxin-antitoxin system